MKRIAFLLNIILFSASIINAEVFTPKENSTCVISSILDLGGKTIKMPSNCILYFKGGLICNGKIYGNRTVVKGISNKILFKNVILYDTFEGKASTDIFENDDDLSVLRNLCCFSDVTLNRDLDVAISDVNGISKQNCRFNGKGHTIKCIFPERAFGHNLIHFNGDAYLENLTITDNTPKKFLTNNFVSYCICFNGRNNKLINVNIESLDRCMAFTVKTQKNVLHGCNLKTSSFAVEGFGQNLTINRSDIRFCKNLSRYSGDILSCGDSIKANLSIDKSNVLGAIELSHGSIDVKRTTLSLVSFGPRGYVDEADYLDNTLIDRCKFIGFSYSPKIVTNNNIVRYIYAKYVKNFVMKNSLLEIKDIDPFLDISADKSSNYINFDNIKKLRFENVDFILSQMPTETWWKPTVYFGSSINHLSFNNCNFTTMDDKTTHIAIQTPIKNIFSTKKSFKNKNVVFYIMDNGEKEIPVRILNNTLKIHVSE